MGRKGQQVLPKMLRWCLGMTEVKFWRLYAKNGFAIEIKGAGNANCARA